ncbi:MAG TPA: hypothetical protein VFL83_02635 [Anaeromyxobacter sp.]|nr:hypothetical protein [Anaeromyxobacter sp.]
MNRCIRRMLTLALCAAVAGAPAAARAWAAGTHAYIAKHTNKAKGIVTDAELCRRVLGANGPDLFNSVWQDEPQKLAGVLHTGDPAANLSPWHAAEGELQRAFAFGFASHNDAWGTDSTAHASGRTFGQGAGYVPAKAAILGAMLARPFADALGLPLEVAQALATDVSHNFVEFAVDFLLVQADPELGWTLYASAGCYAGPADDDLLYDALGLYFAAALSPEDPASRLPEVKAWIDAVERPFVEGLGANGYVLTLPYAVAKPLIAAQLAREGQEYLAWKYAGLLPPDLPFDLLVRLAEAGLDAAMPLCAPDFMDEIEATTGWVNGRMSALGIAP